MQVTRVRFEHFGGIVGTEDPAGLFWVDRDYLESRGYRGGDAWAGEDPGRLRAPVEMEVTLTERCNLRCGCCCAAAGDGEDVPARRVEEALRVAARLEVFHVAFGGGEPLLHPTLLPLAAEARSLGLLVSLTTNGTLVTPDWARRAAGLFARVNVSVDVPGGPRDAAGGVDAYRAVTVLREAGLTAGVNFILSRQGFTSLEDVFRLAAAAGADSVLLLRPKPSGRGRFIYSRIRPTAEQLRRLVPLALEMGERFSLPFHLDCALAPLLVRSDLAIETLTLLGASGCIAGDLLATVDSRGIVHPCSHLADELGEVAALGEAWENHPRLAALRHRAKNLRGDCARCRVGEICRGGCAAVRDFRGLAGRERDPDIFCAEGS